MTETETERWVLAYFEEYGKLAGSPAEDLLDANYFELELLDSLGVVQLIVAAEDDFEVHFEAEHMQDTRLCTIRGLSHIIDELRT